MNSTASWLLAILPHVQVMSLCHAQQSKRPATKK